MRETQIRSLGWEDPLEKGMATHFSILAWRITMTEESGGLQFLGLQRVGHDEQITLSIYMWKEAYTYITLCLLFSRQVVSDSFVLGIYSCKIYAHSF